MTYVLQYHRFVVEKDIPKLDFVYRERISATILSKLTTRPEIYGKPLRSSLFGFRSLRVGSYRVIFRIDKKTVYIYYIEKRDTVYDETRKRLRVIV